MTPVDQAQRLRHLAKSASKAGELRRDGDGSNIPVDAAVRVEAGNPNSAAVNRKGSQPHPMVQQQAKRNLSPNGVLASHTSARPLRQRAPFVTITSGKGGVGKSNIAVNLAIALSNQGSHNPSENSPNRRVTLIDADLGTANADVICGINAPHNLAHLLQGRRKTLANLAVDAPGGFRLVPGASGIRRAAEMTDEQRALLIRELSKLEQTSDLILIDTGAGISDSVTSMTSLADLVVVVLTPEPTSIADAYGLIKTIHREANSTAAAGQRFAILVNMATSRQQARAVYDRVAAVSRRFLGLQLDFAGFIPQDANVSRSVLKRTPFSLAYPHAPASKAIQELAQSIAGFALPRNNQSAQNGRESRQSGYFSRFYNWFRQ